jgi:hypothetical protein
MGPGQIWLGLIAFCVVALKGFACDLRIDYRGVESIAFAASSPQRSASNNAQRFRRTNPLREIAAPFRHGVALIGAG